MAGGVVFVHPRHVSLPVLVGDDEVAEQFADGLFARPPEDDFGFAVPFDDPRLSVCEDHGVEGGLNDAAKQVPAVLQLVQGFVQVLGLAADFDLHALRQQLIGLPLFLQATAEPFEGEVEGADLCNPGLGVHGLVQLTASEGFRGLAQGLKGSRDAGEQKEVQTADGQGDQSQCDLKWEIEFARLRR